MKFYLCSHCGNLITKINDSGVAVHCCGEAMNELIPNTNDAAVEKHIPVIKIQDGKTTIEVGSIIHPMTEEHHIEWIYIEYENGGYYHYFTTNDEPILPIDSDSCIISIYAYCNLHGLWKMNK